MAVGGRSLRYPTYFHRRPPPRRMLCGNEVAHADSARVAYFFVVYLGLSEWKRWGAPLPTHCAPAHVLLYPSLGLASPGASPPRPADPIPPHIPSLSLRFGSLRSIRSDSLRLAPCPFSPLLFFPYRSFPLRMHFRLLSRTPNILRSRIFLRRRPI